MTPEDKARVKQLMDQTFSAYAGGDHVRCEALARKVVEIDPSELAASTLMFRAKMERRYKEDVARRTASEDEVLKTLKGIDLSNLFSGVNGRIILLILGCECQNRATSREAPLGWKLAVRSLSGGARDGE